MERHKVSAEILAIKLYVQQPVVMLVFLIGQRVVDKVVSCLVICRKQFFDGEVVRPGKFYDAYSWQVELVNSI